MRMWIRKPRHQRRVPRSRLGRPRIEIFLRRHPRMESRIVGNRKRPRLQQKITPEQPRFGIGRQQELRYHPNHLLGQRIQKSFLVSRNSLSPGLILPKLIITTFTIITYLQNTIQHLLLLNHRVFDK